MKILNKTTLLSVVAFASIALFAVIGSRITGSGSAEQAPAPVNTNADVSTPDSFTVGGYLPAWLGDADYARISRLEGVDKLYIAFATVDTSGKPLVPTLTSAGISAISTLGKKAQASDDGGVYLSVGGWGSSRQQHDDMLIGFSTALDHPDDFAAELKKATTDVETKTGLMNIGVDLDIEFPDSKMANKLPALVDSLHHAGVSNIAMAVAASGKEAEGVLGVARSLADKDVSFNVMTYDMTGLGSAKAGPIATTAWATNQIATWSGATRDASKISVGFPTYCYTFVGAKKAGDRFDSAASSSMQRYTKDLPAEALVENDAEGTTTARLSDGYTTCVSPNRATATLNAVLHNHPKIGGTFAWDMRGMTDEYVRSLSGNK